MGPEYIGRVVTTRVTGTFTSGSSGSLLVIKISAVYSPSSTSEASKVTSIIWDEPTGTVPLSGSTDNQSIIVLPVTYCKALENN